MTRLYFRTKNEENLLAQKLNKNILFNLFLRNHASCLLFVCLFGQVDFPALLSF